MNPSPLSKALRDCAGKLNDTEVPSEHDRGIACELIRVLARIVEGKSIDKAFGAPGDWGYGTPIGDGVFARLNEPAADNSGIEWHYVTDEMPDDETRVMVALDSKETDEPDFAYHADGKWWMDPGPHLSPLETRVYAWAHVPGVPPRKEGAS